MTERAHESTRLSSKQPTREDHTIFRAVSFFFPGVSSPAFLSSPGLSASAVNLRGSRPQPGFSGARNAITYWNDVIG